VFGIFRTVLALMVVGQHTLGYQSTGRFAVQSFFCLSGFLMTLLCAEVYKGRPLDFAINRILRLYPSYWVVAAITAAVIIVTPVPAMIGQGPWDEWGLPTDPIAFAQNALFAVSVHTLRLVPTAWAVAVELVFYALIAVGATATIGRSLACLAAAAVISILLIDWPDLYFSPAGAALAFAVGGTLYHVQKMPYVRAGVISLGLGTVPVSLALIVAHARGTELAGMPVLYLSMLASCPLMLWLYNLRPPPRWCWIDDAIGRLSYPIYLSHFLPTLLLTLEPPFWIGAPWFIPAVLAVTLALSVALVLLVDIPVERIRSAIRDRGAFAAGNNRARPSYAQIDDAAM
jgi:peptidoglycan/LPS O-acetylase OafA/YrhL